MTMLTNELDDVRSVSTRQVYRIQKDLGEREVPEHFAKVLTRRIATGELSNKEAQGAIKRLETLPFRKEK